MSNTNRIAYCVGLYIKKICECCCRLCTMFVNRRHTATKCNLSYLQVLSTSQISVPATGPAYSLGFNGKIVLMMGFRTKYLDSKLKYFVVHSGPTLSEIWIFLNIFYDFVSRTLVDYIIFRYSFAFKRRSKAGNKSYSIRHNFTVTFVATINM